jgi:hypothetical protein
MIVEITIVEIMIAEIRATEIKGGQNRGKRLKAFLMLTRRNFYWTQRINRI